MSALVKGMKKQLFLLALLLLVLTPVTLFANAAEPPGLIILVSHPPEDLSLSLVFTGEPQDHSIQLAKKEKAWEAYFRYFYHMDSRNERDFEGATVIVLSGGLEARISLPEGSFETYNNLLTLELDEGRLIEGQRPYRTPLLIAMRVIATLVLEGLILLAFGYRQKSSWLLFLGINLITQGGLNFLFTGPLLSAYWLIGYYLVEAVIFLVEMVLFGIFLREGSRKRAVLYAFLANLLSLVAGGILLTALPV